MAGSRWQDYRMKAILEIKDLSVVFHTFEGKIQALDRISFEVFPGETLGVVGESGCGKSVTALATLRLIPTPPGEITNGSINYRGKDILSLPPREMCTVRGQKISMIFQEPMTSLSPVFTVGEQISEVYRQHKKIKRREAMDQSIEMLKKVNIPEPQKVSRYYPHEMSGGMRQRAMIAMALACKPELLIADEPSTGCDHPGAGYRFNQRAARRNGDVGDFYHPRSGSGGPHRQESCRYVYGPDS
jgi:ABC-type dipeptide/oligopeptide/nickel transport system ATPase component